MPIGITVVTFNIFFPLLSSGRDKKERIFLGNGRVVATDTFGPNYVYGLMSNQVTGMKICCKNGYGQS